MPTVTHLASKLELAVYHILKLRKMAHEIEAIQTQDIVLLSDAKINMFLTSNARVQMDLVSG